MQEEGGDAIPESVYPGCRVVMKVLRCQEVMVWEDGRLWM